VKFAVENGSLTGVTLEAYGATLPEHWKLLGSLQNSEDEWMSRFRNLGWPTHRIGPELLATSGSLEIVVQVGPGNRTLTVRRKWNRDLRTPDHSPR
jgi:hypothetical protein